MENSKYTPGPWDWPKGSITVRGPKPENIKICDMSSVVATCPPYSLSVSEQEANARLIAAAPELLDVASRWISCLTSLAEGNPSKHYRGLLQTTIMHDMKQAIAKAEGK